MQNKRKGKWLPFDSLEGYRSSLKEVEEEIEKVKKPSLSEDKIEDINQELVKAFEEKSPLSIHFYNKGSIIKIEGIITKIDLINQKIKIGNKFIDLVDIIDAKIII